MSAPNPVSASPPSRRTQISKDGVTLAVSLPPPNANRREPSIPVRRSQTSASAAARLPPSAFCAASDSVRVKRPSPLSARTNAVGPASWLPFGRGPDPGPADDADQGMPGNSTPCVTNCTARFGMTLAAPTGGMRKPEEKTHMARRSPLRPQVARWSREFRHALVSSESRSDAAATRATPRNS